MGFWRNVGKVAKIVAKVGLTAVVENAAAGRPITIGNIGRAAAGGAVKELGRE